MRTSGVILHCALVYLLAALPAAWASEVAGPFHRVTLSELHKAVLAELDSQTAGPHEPFPIDEIELPLAVPVRAGSALRVSSACWDADAGRARFRFECVREGDCLPFLAYVRTTPQVSAPSCGMRSPSRSPRLLAPILLRAGERATAVLKVTGIQMTAPVTCLEPGSAGNIIRVRGLQGNVFRARIVGQALVETTLE